VLEGAGRTLKGRDLRQVRNAVWRKTGLLDWSIVFAFGSSLQWLSFYVSNCFVHYMRGRVLILATPVKNSAVLLMIIICKLSVWAVK
jgi:hypothetical protein